MLIAKDFTELGIQEQYKLLGRLSDAVFAPSTETVFLVAANEGIITRKATGGVPGAVEQAFVTQYGANLEQFADLLERLLTSGLSFDPEKQGLRVYDLSKVPSAEILKRVLTAVVEHEGWRACDGCVLQTPASGSRCLLHENRERLRKPLVQRRLSNLVQLLDLNQEHLTVRHLFTLVANAITGHASSQGEVPMVTSCEELASPPFIEAPKINGAYFQNIFGLNLRRRAKSKPFSSLSRLGVGVETNNRIDRLLTYGDIDLNLSEDFGALVLKDDYFVDPEEYAKLQRSYRERDPDAGDEPETNFLREIESQRRRLYFELPEELEERYRHHELVSFHSAAEFRRRIIARLSNGEKVTEPVVRKMIVGLNRAFIGGLTEAEDKLYLATSGTTSQERISNVLVHAVAHDQLLPASSGVTIVGRGESAAEGGAADLVVNFQGKLLGRLPLTLARYEFLSRLAEGVLPVSFSLRVYEDILVFKSQLLQNLAREFPTDQLPITMLDVLPDGQVKALPLQVEE